LLQLSAEVGALHIDPAAQLLHLVCKFFA
jgi:hypothetical protein